MKHTYIAMLFCIFLSAACSSPAKKQHNDKRIKANTFQNTSAEATTDHENSISSGNLTNSTHIDTGERK